MTGRALLGELPDGTYGLRVSRPGYEVTDDTIDDNGVAFDSRWQAAARVLMSGLLIGTGSAITVSFGQTFAAPPTVLAMEYGTIPYTPTAQYWYNVTGFPLTDSYWGSSGLSIDVEAQADHFVWHYSASGLKLAYIVLII